MKFKTIHSLGSRCQNSEILKLYKYREFSGFFDFMNTEKVDIINHILEDDFTQILNPNNNEVLYYNGVTLDPETGVELKSSYRTINRFYTPNATIHYAIFPHHNLNDEKDINHFMKCKKRFKNLVNYNVLFNYTFNTWENNINEFDIQKMIDTLKNVHGFKTFKVCFIGVKKGNIGEYKKITSNEYYDVWELTIGYDSFTGGLFKNNQDNENYISIIKTYDIDDNRITKNEIDTI